MKMGEHGSPPTQCHPDKATSQNASLEDRQTESGNEDDNPIPIGDFNKSNQLARRRHGRGQSPPDPHQMCQ